MRTTRPGLVDIVREFLGAHQMLRRLFARYREGSLRFDELGALIGDDERSLLFRLKERCHGRFRNGEDSGMVAHRDAMFDLAVGSLFHEAMKFRENFYQREVYGPRVEALRSEADDEEALLFEEFTRIQHGVSERIEEGLAETEALLARTADQLCHLLTAHRDDPLVTRFLVENDDAVSAATGRTVAALLTEMHGDAGTGFTLAGRSFVGSGYYPAAIAAFSRALEHGSDGESIVPLEAYALGMAAYLDRDYATAIEHLGRWADTTADDDPNLARLACDAVGRIGQLARGEGREQVIDDASALLDRLSPESDHVN